MDHNHNHEHKHEINTYGNIDHTDNCFEHLHTHSFHADVIFEFVEECKLGKILRVKDRLYKKNKIIVLISDILASIYDRTLPVNMSTSKRLKFIKSLEKRLQTSMSNPKFVSYFELITPGSVNNVILADSKSKHDVLKNIILEMNVNSSIIIGVAEITATCIAMTVLARVYLDRSIHFIFPNITDKFDSSLLVAAAWLSPVIRKNVFSLLGSFFIPEGTVYPTGMNKEEGIHYLDETTSFPSEELEYIPIIPEKQKDVIRDIVLSTRDIVLSTRDFQIIIRPND